MLNATLFSLSLTHVMMASPILNPIRMSGIKISGCSLSFSTATFFYSSVIQEIRIHSSKFRNCLDTPIIITSATPHSQYNKLFGQNSRQIITTGNTYAEIGTCTFDATRSKCQQNSNSYGGAIFYERAQEFRLKNCIFSRCYAYGLGGAVCVMRNRKDTERSYVDKFIQSTNCYYQCGFIPPTSSTNFGYGCYAIATNLDFGYSCLYGNGNSAAEGFALQAKDLQMHNNNVSESRYDFYRRGVVVLHDCWRAHVKFLVGANNWQLGVVSSTFYLYKDEISGAEYYYSYFNIIGNKNRKNDAQSCMIYHIYMNDMWLSIHLWMDHCTFQRNTYVNPPGKDRFQGSIMQDTRYFTCTNCIFDAAGPGDISGWTGNRYYVFSGGLNKINGWSDCYGYDSKIFTMSSKFTPSLEFTPSSNFSYSQQFSISENFTCSNKFEASTNFTYSYNFNQSNAFTPTETFFIANALDNKIKNTIIISSSVGFIIIIIIIILIIAIVIAKSKKHTVYSSSNFDDFEDETLDNSNDFISNSEITELDTDENQFKPDNSEDYIIAEKSILPDDDLQNPIIEQNEIIGDEPLDDQHEPSGIFIPIMERSPEVAIPLIIPIIITQSSTAEEDHLEESDEFQEESNIIYVIDQDCFQTLDSKTKRKKKIVRRKKKVIPQSPSEESELLLNEEDTIEFTSIIVEPEIIEEKPKSKKKKVIRRRKIIKQTEPEEDIIRSITKSEHNVDETINMQPREINTARRVVREDSQISYDSQKILDAEVEKPPRKKVIKRRKKVKKIEILLEEEDDNEF